MSELRRRQKMKPPEKIDAARVVEWAWSGERPFGHVIGGDPAEAVFGLAITVYEKSTTVYRFSCDARWETVQDGVYSSIEEAKRLLPTQYKNVSAVWRAYEA